jgi:hypothetical protein
MNTATTITRLGATTAALVLLTGAAPASPASVKYGIDDNPRISNASASRASSSNQARKTKRGNCSAATNWKLRAKPRDGRLEVEFEVDSNVTGQLWTYELLHDRAVKASGLQTTTPPSGSFSVERRLPNAAGVHTISAAAKNTGTGETCKARLKI